MEILNFDITVFGDLKTYGAFSVFEMLFDFFTSEIEKGKVLIIEQRYTNAKSDPLYKITSKEELEAFFNQYRPQ